MRRLIHKLLLLNVIATCAAINLPAPARADVSVPRIFGSNMVLQRDQPVRVWGWAELNEQVNVSINGKTVSTKAGNDKRWDVKLPAMQAGGPHTLTVKGNNTLTLENVLVGEVWICSGQSNMAWTVNNSNDSDLEKLTANYPKIRLISVPQVGVQEPQKDFGGEGWLECSPETVSDFSGVGYFFGRRLHQTLNVPIGLIDNAWGGSAAEAWVRRDKLESDKRYDELMARWKETEATFDYDKQLAAHKQRLAAWQDKAKQLREAGKPVGQPPRPPRNVLAGQHRPGNLYCGVLHPTIGFTIRGAIWYQGESNAARSYQYRHLFPLMIQSWRDEWGQGDFPFYYVQLADYRDEQPAPMESGWAELREAQTMTMDKLKNVGEAVIIDVGEAHDIHPRNKQTVANRLARWALAKDYGLKIAYQSPRYSSHKIGDNGRVQVTFQAVGSGLDTFDVRQPIGFTIATEDGDFVLAQARIVSKDTIEVWSSDVSKPAAVRYAWADNPVCNVQNREGLPLTPFRTDDRKGVTADAH